MDIALVKSKRSIHKLNPRQIQKKNYKDICVLLTKKYIIGKAQISYILTRDD